MLKTLSLVVLLCLSLSSASFGVQVFLWSPTEEQKFGHVGILTSKYYASFWPDGDVKDYGLMRSTASGMDGSLVFHWNYDRFLEGRRDPSVIYKLSKISEKAIERSLENFLTDNKINPKKVSRDSAERLIEEALRPETSLRMSRYSLMGYIVHKDKGNGRFYARPQSCTTFVANLLNIGAGRMVIEENFSPLRVEQDSIDLLCQDFRTQIEKFPGTSIAL